MAGLDQTIAALRRLGQSAVLPARILGPDTMRLRAAESAAFIAVTAPGLSSRANAVLERLSAPPPDLRLCPIHGDMKLEHVFLDGERTCLIDTESVVLGLPDYDLAQLGGRLCQAELDGLLSPDLVTKADARIRAAAGPAYDWCRDVVALRLAKFHAQRPAPGMPDRLRAILDRLA
jgi:aminoglycoside phosphotransferase (APT) family kinase protein